MSKSTYRFLVEVQSDFEEAKVRQVLDRLINVGLEDAGEVHSGECEGDTENAAIAVSSDWHSPRSLSEVSTGDEGNALEKPAHE